jgi:hypothetical protein
VDDVVAAVKLPTAPPLPVPALRADGAPVAQAVATVTGTVTDAVDAKIAGVTPVVSALLHPSD